ncbi:MAG: hypothetical protein WA510_03610, partial [Acidobacteriaceae bacterium]
EQRSKGAGMTAALVGGLMGAPYMRWARRTTREVLESLTRNPELTGVLAAQWGDYGLPLLIGALS